MNRKGANKGGVGQDVPNVGFPGGLTYDKSIIMALQLSEPAIGRISRHQGADRPLINRARVGVSLEDARGDKGLQHEPSANVDTVMEGRDVRRCRGHDEGGRVMGTRVKALTRRVCRPPTSMSYSGAASTSSAGRCHCTDLPDPRPLRFNCKIIHSSFEEEKKRECAHKNHRMDSDR